MVKKKAIENTRLRGRIYTTRDIWYFKYHEYCKSLIARVFKLLLIYYMTKQIASKRALICTAMHIK